MRIYYQRARHLVVLHDMEDKSRLFEEIVLLKDMQLVKLHRVYTHLYVYGRLQQERLVLLVGCHLYGYAPHAAKRIPAKLLDEEFRIGFHLSLSLEGPGIALCHHVHKVQIVIAVVHHVGLKTRIGYLLDVYGHKGKACIQFVASVSLPGGCTVRYLAVGSVILVYRHVRFGLMVVQYRLDAAAVVPQFCGSMRLCLLFGIHLGSYHLTHGIVVLLYHDNIAYRSRNFKTVLVLYQDYVITLETGYLSAAGLTQKSYFVTYFHYIVLF